MLSAALSDPWQALNFSAGNADWNPLKIEGAIVETPINAAASGKPAAGAVGTAASRHGDVGNERQQGKHRASRSHNDTFA
jgi:hypothetical protein